MLIKHELEHEHKRNIDMCLWLKYSRDTTLTPNLSRTSHISPTLTFWATHTQTDFACIFWVCSIHARISALVLFLGNFFPFSLFCYTFFANIFRWKETCIIWGRSEGSMIKFDKIKRFRFRKLWILFILLVHSRWERESLENAAKECFVSVNTSTCYLCGKHKFVQFSYWNALESQKNTKRSLDSFTFNSYTFQTDTSVCTVFRASNRSICLPHYWSIQIL